MRKWDQRRHLWPTGHWTHHGSFRVFPSASASKHSLTHETQNKTFQHTSCLAWAFLAVNELTVRSVRGKKKTCFFLLLRQKYISPQKDAVFCTYWQERLQQDVVGPAVRASASRAASGPRQSLAEEEEMQHSMVDRASLVFGVSKKWNAPRRPRASSVSADCPEEFVTWSRRGGTKRGRAVSGVQVFLSFVGAMKACSAAPSGGLVQRFATAVAFLV